MSKEFAPIFSDLFFYKMQSAKDSAVNKIRELDKNMPPKKLIKDIDEIEKEYLQQIKNLNLDGTNIQP